MRVYAITIFIGAFLLFQVEPMIAKYILPWFGGTAAVWTTCLLFFQMILLAGYAYSHVVGTRLAARQQVITHLTLVGACVVIMGMLALFWRTPIMPGANWKPADPDSPVLRILFLLSASIGLPYFVLSATAPLLQAWFGQVHPGISPYKLYSLSNLGSLLALLSYPFVVEPSLTLRVQADAWSAMYLFFALAMVLCAMPLLNLTATARTSAAAAQIGPPLEHGDRVEDAGRVEHQARRRAPAKRRERQHGRERKQQPQRPPATARVRRPPYIFWIALPACASLLLYAATNEMTHDVAPIPFLWVVPLALYLLSFIICFDNERWYQRGIFHPALALAVFFGLLVRFASFDDSSLLIRLAAPSVLLFAVCMVCHGELARLKPDQRRLTAFYLMVSAGGAIGGIFAVVIAPLIFPGYWEYSLAIWLCPVLLFMVLVRDPKSWIHEYNTVPALLLLSAALALPGLFDYYPFASTRLYIVSASAFVGLIAVLGLWKKPRFLARPGVLIRFSMIAAILVVGAILVSDPILNAPLMLTRNFYGVFDVSLAPDDEQPKYPAYQLTNGGILHGSQSFAPEWRYRPVTYYGPSSGIGVLMINDPRRAAADSEKSSIRVGGVGLGIGTIAAWGSSGDSFRFYEINPAIIKLATDPKGYFTYVSDSSAKVEIIPGDARLSMEREVREGHAQQFDVLAIDAFNGDAIPTHLLTAEAMQIYLRELKPDGVIAVHITNTYVDLRPVLAELCRSFDLRCGEVTDNEPEDSFYFDSDWILLARNDHVLGEPGIAAHLNPINSIRKVALWTDDYSNLFQLLR